MQQAAVAAVLWPLQKSVVFAPRSAGNIMTVRGLIDTADLGMTLPHEHILVDFIGADQVHPSRYRQDEVFRTMLPYLQQIKNWGCSTFVDCTPAYLGRDVVLLQRLSEASGIQIVTNTGYYSAVNNKYLPRHAFRETANELADRWIQEFQNGIEGTGIRPGFIKISVDKAPLTQINEKIIRAAARTHLHTGLTIASHTGNGAAALEQIALLKEEGVHPSAFIWVHAQNEEDETLHRKAAREGAWIEFDGLGWAPVEQYKKYVYFMEREGLLNHLLISHDAGWYHVGEQAGGTIKPFTVLFEQLLPGLKSSGFSEEKIKKITTVNPQKAFTLSVRKL